MYIPVAIANTRVHPEKKNIAKGKPEEKPDEHVCYSQMLLVIEPKLILHRPGVNSGPSEASVKWKRAQNFLPYQYS